MDFDGLPYPKVPDIRLALTPEAIAVMTPTLSRRLVALGTLYGSDFENASSMPELPAKLLLARDSGGRPRE